MLQKQELLKKRYLEGLQGKATTESLIKKLKDEIIVIQKKMQEKMKLLQESLQKLDKITLRTNPLIEKNIMEMLIESENMESKPGYTGCIKLYQRALADAQLVLIARGSKEETVTYKKYDQVMKFC